MAGVFALYWLLPWRGRIYLLLGSSYYFYGVWDARFLALLLASTSLDFFFGLAIAGQRQSLGKLLLNAAIPLAWLVGFRLIAGTTTSVGPGALAAAAAFPILLAMIYEWLWRLEEQRRKRAFLVGAIVIHLALLFFFKYYNFFAGSLAELLGRLGWQPGWTLLNVILPVGISFYTFQSIAYAVDVYRGEADPPKDFPLYAAYLAFFPQLVAGPIERPNELLPQFQRPVAWLGENFSRGLRLILVGLFKKVFVADNCALLANYAFDPKTPLNGWWATLGVVAFAFQIYGDFSGYTDIARGSARLLGIQLSRNFFFPYTARGPSDFWQRWHITLSTWIRDYIYIPLGGNRGGKWFTMRNLLIAMLLAGLWHGAAWTFVLWGAYHGLLLCLYRLSPGLKRLETAERGWRVPVSIAVMFICTLIGWALFRSPGVGQFTNWLQAFGNWQTVGYVDWAKPAGWLLIHIVPLLLLQWATTKSRDEIEFTHFPWLAREAVYVVLFLLVATSAVSDAEFIYFQF